MKYISGDAPNDGTLDDSLCISEESAGGITLTNVENTILTVTGNLVFANPVTFTSAQTQRSL